jgi:predicted regulator of Ras-like GTPase activity (Roadblock/LC7/MglB family)
MDEYTKNVFAAAGLNKIQVELEMLRRDLGATGVMLLDEDGHLLLERGKHGDYDVNTFLALLANAMSASNAVINLLHDKSAFDLHIHEGTSYEMYTSRINDHVFLSLTLEKRPGSSRVGMVWITLRRAVPGLRELIEQAAVKPGTTEDKEIHNAISGTLTQAMESFESNMPAGKPFESTKPANFPREQVALQDQTKEDSTESDPPANKKQARKEESTRPAHDLHDQASPPDLTTDGLLDPNRTLTYEEARRLGLINLDNIDRNSGQ